MKKITLWVVMAFVASTGWAQNLEQINDLMAKMKFKEARVGIDKYLQDAKKANDSEAWYYKGRIYNSLSRDSTVPQSDLFNLRSEAFASFKKNQLLDPKDIYLALEAHVSYLDLYFGFYDLGAKEFNASKFDGALESFKKAMEVKDYIISKKYTYEQTALYPLDTSLVLNAAASALQAKKEDEAVSMYRKLTDANVSGKDYKEVYEYLVDYYSKKEDESSLKPLLEKAKRFYPKNDYWLDVEVRAVSKKGDKAALLAKYDELIAQNPTNFTLAYNYAIEQYNVLYGKDAKPTEDLTAKHKLTETLKNAIANENIEDISATVLMANHLFNMSADLLNASNIIKSTKPDDVKKKADLKAAANKSMDECITHAETAVKFYEAIPSKTGGQKANYKIVLSYLIDIYGIKNNKAKVAEYEKKNAAADKM